MVILRYCDKKYFLLIKMCESASKFHDGNYYCTVTLKDLGYNCGIRSRETVSKYIDEFESDGLLIRSGRSKYRIPEFTLDFVNSSIKVFEDFIAMSKGEKRKRKLEIKLNESKLG